MSSMDLTNVIFDHISSAADAAQSVEVVNAASSTAGMTTGEGIANLGKYLGAAFSMFGAIGVGASQGYAAGSAAVAVGRNPDAQPKILNTMIVGMAITEAVAIYCFIVAILIIFVA